MCSRYFLELKALMELKERIDYEFELFMNKDYFPSDEVLILIAENNCLEIKKARWGFKAFNNKLVINARSETLIDKPMFKNEVYNHRCLILASGFYEWDSHKHKFTFEDENHHLLLMAGIYRIIDGQLEVVIITTKANKSMQGIHDRMPLILDSELIESWLNGNQIDNFLKIKPQSLQITSGILQHSLF